MLIDIRNAVVHLKERGVFLVYVSAGKPFGQTYDQQEEDHRQFIEDAIREKLERTRTTGGSQ